MNDLVTKGQTIPSLHQNSPAEREIAFLRQESYIYYVLFAYGLSSEINPFILFVQTISTFHINRRPIMQKMTLKFKSANQLWAFKQLIKSQDVEINLNQCTITCDCSEDELTLAIEKFDAEVLSTAGGS